MIETIAALVALMTAIQSAMMTYNLEQGRSWAITVRPTITDAQLTAAKAPCCELMIDNNTGKIFRGPGGLVFLIRVR